MKKYMAFHFCALKNVMNNPIVSYVFKTLPVNSAAHGPSTITYSMGWYGILWCLLYISEDIPSILTIQTVYWVYWLFGWDICTWSNLGSTVVMNKVALKTVPLHHAGFLSNSMAQLCKVHDRRKFRSQTSDNMDRWKAEQGRGREKRKIRREKIRRERVRRKKMQMREKVGKSRNTVFFQWFVAPEGRKVGLLKRRVRSQLARREMKNCTPLWARSTFPSQNVQNTPWSEHFWKLRCQKSARRCGAKHISKSKCTKHQGFGPLLEVEMSKKCTPLWREAHFQVKMYKTPGVRTTFGSWDVEKVHAVVARSTFPSQNVQNTSAADHFWKLRCQKSARRCGAKHISKSKCTKHQGFGPLLEVEMSKSARRCGAKHISKSKCTKHQGFGPLLEVEMSNKCTPLWWEADFEVKMHKTLQPRTTFGGSDVEKVSKKCTPLWREAHFEVKSVKNWGFWAFFDVKMSKK